MQVDHAADPLHFASEITVVRAGLHAGGDEPRAIQGVWSDRREHDARARRQVRDSGTIGAVGDDEVECFRAVTEPGF